MKENNDRRNFIKKVSLTSLGLGLANTFGEVQANPAPKAILPVAVPEYIQSDPSLTFIPRRTATGG